MEWFGLFCLGFGHFDLSSDHLPLVSVTSTLLPITLPLASVTSTFLPITCHLFRSLRPFFRSLCHSLRSLRPFFRSLCHLLRSLRPFFRSLATCSDHFDLSFGHLPIASVTPPPDVYKKSQPPHYFSKGIGFAIHKN